MTLVPETGVEPATYALRTHARSATYRQSTVRATSEPTTPGWADTPGWLAGIDPSRSGQDSLYNHKCQLSQSPTRAEADVNA